MDTIDSPAGRRTAEQVANLLVALHEREFGGKKFGRFYLSERRFKKLARRKRLWPSFEQEVYEILLDYGLVLARLDDGFSVCALHKHAAWRSLGKQAADALEDAYHERGDE